MKTTALAQQAPFEATLTVMSGPSRGTVYRVVSSKVALGRGAENDIIISDDPKCSRNHAELVLGPQGFEIRNLTDRNSLSVNGEECKIARLGDKSIFMLGDTQFRLAVKTTHNLPTRHLATAPTRANAAARPTRKILPIHYIIVAVIALAIWLAFNNSKKQELAKTADQLAEQELKAAESVKQLAEERHRPKSVSPNDIGYQQAQQAFVEGSRDYRKGQFERALSSFQACLSLYPAHALCTRYMRLTQRRFDELIQYHMVLGSKYRDQNQFGACAASFRNVMVMVKDQSHKRYKEAKANYEACQAHLEERF